MQGLSSGNGMAIFSELQSQPYQALLQRTAAVSPASLRPLQTSREVTRHAYPRVLSYLCPVRPTFPVLCAGGDWGSAISTALGGMYPQNCRAIHVNMCFARPSYTNPWHLAQILNAKVPIANWFPLAISYQVGVTDAGPTLHALISSPSKTRSARKSVQHQRFWPGLCLKSC